MAPPLPSRRDTVATGALGLLLPAAPRAETTTAPPAFAGGRLLAPAGFDAALHAVAGSPGKPVALKVQHGAATIEVCCALAPWP